MKKFGLILLAVFYILAGLNHFRTPFFYIPLIPDFFVYKSEINILSGIIEIALGVLLIFRSTRTYAVYLIILMLIAFIPSHVYLIQEDGCIRESLCVDISVAWIRLLVVHPLLIWWAYSYRNY